MDKKIKKISEIEEGDTFLLKIESSKDKNLNGRYFVIIYTVVPFWNKDESKYNFLIKITKDKKKPQTKKEIEELEYVKVGSLYSFERFAMSRIDKDLDKELEKQSKIPFELNEYGLIDTYVYKIYMGNKSPFKSLEYIGNFSIAKPKNEFIPFHCFASGTNAAHIKYLEEGLVSCYNLYNLRKSGKYDLKQTDKIKERMIFEFCHEYKMNKYLIDREDESKRIPELEYFFRERPDEKRKENSLTYVGEGKDPCKKKKSKKEEA